MPDAPLQEPAAPPEATTTTPGSDAGRRDFGWLWAGDAVSQLGSQLTLLALPVLAVERFDAGAFEMGLLATLGSIAFLIVGLPSGAWVDRMRKRRVLIVTDLLRAALLASLPIALLLDAGSMTHLYLVAFAVGTCTVFFDVAWQSYLPLLVPRSRLTAANSRLSATQSVAHVAGPALGGQLLRLLGAPLVLALDALSFLLSALLLRGIRHRERLPQPGSHPPLGSAILEGLRFVLGHRLLARITACTALSNLAGGIGGALLVLFALRELDMSEAALGLVFSVGAIGGLLGALSASAAARLVGEGRIVALSIIVTIPGFVLTPLVVELPGRAELWLAIASALVSWGGVVYNVTQVSFRQRVCPPQLLGRMNATIRFLVWGTLPLGSMLGGVLGGAFGIVTALWVSAAIATVAVLPVLLSPLATARSLDDLASV